MPGTRRPQQHQPPEGRGRARGLCVEDKPFGIANFNMEISFQSFFFSSLISGDVLHEVFEIQEHFDSS